MICAQITCAQIFCQAMDDGLPARGREDEVEATRRLGDVNGKVLACATETSICRTFSKGLPPSERPSTSKFVSPDKLSDPAQPRVQPFCSHR
jgi:hypothetical protein